MHLASFDPNLGVLSNQILVQLSLISA